MSASTREFLCSYHRESEVESALRWKTKKYAITRRVLWGDSAADLKRALEGFGYVVDKIEEKKKERS